MLAIFLMTASIAVVAATMPISTISRGKSDLYNKAQNLAQKELERVRALGYPNATAALLLQNSLIDSDTPTTGTTYSWTNVDAGLNHSPATVLPSGTGSLTIDQVDNDLRRITVTVTYSDRGKTLSYSTGTLIANV
jgi:hypothetical protein